MENATGSRPRRQMIELGEVDIFCYRKVVLFQDVKSKKNVTYITPFSLRVWKMALARASFLLLFFDDTRD